MALRYRISSVVTSLALVFLCFQVLILFRNEKYVLHDENRNMKESQLTDSLIRRVKETIKSRDFLELKMLTNGTGLGDNWKEDAMMYKVVPLKKRFLTFGIPTIRRQNASYIFGTVHSLLNHTLKSELPEIYIVILLADFDERWRYKMAEIFENKYPELVADGTLQIIQAPKSFYPPLDNLQHTYQDPNSKRKWKSKQNADYAYIFMYSQYLSTYYMQLEDDIYTVAGYIETIKEYISQHKEGWTCIEFSELGFIGKLFHSTDLEKLAKMTLLFYEEQPVDFTYIYFDILRLQPERIIRRPTIFQHVGWHSSYPGRIQPLKDRYFDVVKKKYKGDNPPAKIYTSLKVHPDFLPESAYSLEDGYFWAHDAGKAKDTFTVVFNEPQSVDRVVIITGSPEHPSDKIENAILEGCLTFVGVKNNNAVCTNDVIIGKFKNGTIDVGGIGAKMGPFKINCLRVTLTLNQYWWIIIREIAVFLSDKSKS